MRKRTLSTLILCAVLALLATSASSLIAPRAETPAEAGRSDEGSWSGGCGNPEWVCPLLSWVPFCFMGEDDCFPSQQACEAVHGASNCYSLLNPPLE